MLIQSSPVFPLVLSVVRNCSHRLRCRSLFFPCLSFWLNAVVVNESQQSPVVPRGHAISFLPHSLLFLHLLLPLLTTTSPLASCIMDVDPPPVQSATKPAFLFIKSGGNPRQSIARLMISGALCIIQCESSNSASWCQDDRDQKSLYCDVQFCCCCFFFMFVLFQLIYKTTLHIFVRSDPPCCHFSAPLTILIKPVSANSLQKEYCRAASEQFIISTQQNRVLFHWSGESV